MSRTPYRRRSDQDARTLPPMSTPRARTTTPALSLHAHATSHCPPTDSSRSIPYIDAIALSQLLSSDRTRAAPRHRNVLSDLSTDRLLRVPVRDRTPHDTPRPPTYSTPATNNLYSESVPLPHSTRVIRHRPDHVPRPHPHPSSKPSGISWHRPRPNIPTNQNSNNTTATSSGAGTPTTAHYTTTPVSANRIATRRKPRHITRRHSTYATSAIPDYPTPALEIVEEKPSYHSMRHRRRTSYLTAFSTRKLSALNWIPDHLRDVPSDAVFDHQLIHPVIQLVPFGHHPTCDVIILFTNSMRTELNDFIFLIGCLQHSIADPLKKKKQHKHLETDFRIWYHWFAQFTVQILRGFEDFVFPFLSDLLERRDMMISRPTAAFEAKGVSYPEAWALTTSDLFQKIEQVREYLGTIHDRLFRLQQKPGDAEDAARAVLWQSTFDTVGKLIPDTVALLSQLDHSIAAILALQVECKKGLRKMYRQFAILMIREGSPPLGWSAVTGLTRCISDRKLRSHHASALARAARQSLFSRYRADHSHDNIVKSHRIRVYDEQRRRG